MKMSSIVSLRGFGLALAFSLLYTPLAVQAQTKCKSGKPACGFTTDRLGKSVAVCCSASQSCDHEQQECIDNTRLGHVLPAYIVLTILYEAPGNASSVTYGANSTTGSGLDVSSSLKNAGSWGFSGGASAKSDKDSSVGDTVTVSGSGDGTNGFSTENGDDKTVVTSKQTTLSLKLQSFEDALNHDHDFFILWINPDIKVTYDANTQSTAGMLVSRQGQPIRWIGVLASQLEGKEPMTQIQKSMLSKLKPSDYQAILALDPALQGASFASSKDRYDLIGTTVSVTGPAVQGSPALTTTLDIKSAKTQSEAFVSTTTSTDDSSASLGIIDLFKSSTTITSTYKSSLTLTNGQGEEITGVFGSSTVGEGAVYNVYYDKVFRTFAFEVDAASSREGHRTHGPSRAPSFKASVTGGRRAAK